MWINLTMITHKKDKIFDRPCKKCGRSFTPTSKENKMCPECVKNSYRRKPKI